MVVNLQNKLQVVLLQQKDFTRTAIPPNVARPNSNKLNVVLPKVIVQMSKQKLLDQMSLDKMPSEQKSGIKCSRKKCLGTKCCQTTWP